MKVKINEKLICIPPHISATWDQVAFLHSEEESDTKKFTLIIHLYDGKVVEIPHLDTALVEIAFSSHLKHLEGKSTVKKGAEGKNLFGNFLQQITGLSPEQLANIPIRFGISGAMPGMENIEMAFQHNLEQANSPDMPPEVLEKVSGMAKMMLGNDLNSFPKAEPHCNCTHCQLARAIHNTPRQNPEPIEEIVADEELKFRSWDVKEKGGKLYLVTNPLDSQEQYTVFLGTPIGCTCGHADCEHIKAVLYS